MRARVGIWTVILSLAAPGAFAGSVKTALAGHVPAAMKSAALQGRAAADEPVDLSLVVRVDQALLDETIKQIYAPGMGKKNFLSPGQFSQKFGLAAKRQALKDFAAANGLTVDPYDHPNSLVVRVSGPASVVENAFGVTLNHYVLPDGRKFRGHGSEPLIPSELAEHLGAVMGLNNLAGVMRPHVKRAPALRPGAVSPALLGGMTGPGGNGMSPADIKTTYGLTLPLNGTGQVIAIVELDGFAPADIAAYETQFAISPPPAVSVVSVDGAPANKCGPGLTLPCNASTEASDAGMDEVALDIELVLAMTPKANQLQVYTSFNTAQGLLDIFTKIAADDIAETVTCSWGGPEQETGSAYLASENAVFAQMAAQGQSMYAASGDQGAYADPTRYPTLMVDDPASQPYVTGVGGTTLTGFVGASVETVWNNCVGPTTCGISGLSGATGGGVSGNWTMPTYQAGVSGTASRQYRNVPDVTLNADDINSPYSIYVAGSWGQFGGTSAAAPLWAGFTALINQNRFNNGNGNLGFASPYFYALGTTPSYATTFNDVTTGGNEFYNAGAGYDNASGWGSPKMNNMITALTGVTVVPSPPPPQNIRFTFFSTDTISLGWTDVAGTSYTMVLSSVPSFSTLISSGTGLADQNTTTYFMLPPATYYFQVKVSTNPDASYSAAISTYVPGLPPPPPPANVQWTAVSSNSLSAAWTNVAGNTYEMVLSTVPSFSTIVSSGVGLLNQNTTTYAVAPGFYYFKVKISTNTDLSFSAPIATAAANLAGTGTSALCDFGTVLTVTPIYGPITVTFPPGACGPYSSTSTVAIPTITPGLSTGHGGTITPLGPMVDITLSQPIGQFSLPVTVQMTVQPPNVNARFVRMAWYDPKTGQWWPELQSSYDPLSRHLTGTIWHNSIHGAVILNASADLAQVTVFPNPINFGTSARGTVKFMGLSPQPTINIYTVAGERVISLPPGTRSGATFNDGLTGTAEWDGKNAFGSPVARGTYIYVIRDAAGHQHTGKIGVTR